MTRNNSLQQTTPASCSGIAACNRFTSCCEEQGQIVHMDRGDNIRIISARRESAREKRKYAENESYRKKIEMLDEYDFSSGVRGKYVSRYRQGTT
jgi:hypothetical protein